ncbi:YtxH domain-containing protein [Patescibacteria group bacterium]|mgnify:CR=1 FL=1|nr:YtxH domain-containing protein [Patescibacteria group bacterium]
MSEHSSYHPDQSNFVAGFSLGLLAGAAGYFLFATEKGAKMRKQLVQEWESAQDYLLKEGALPNKVNLRQFLQHTFEEVFQASLPTELMSPSKLRKASKAPARRAKRGKFSGV